MAEFKIRQGLSTVLFSEPGIVNPRLFIEAGCWYLTTDTYELFVGVETSSGEYTLKKINEKTSTGNNTDFEDALEALQKEVASLRTLKLYKRIDSEDDLPKNFDAEDFNPNITYYVVLTDAEGANSGKVSTYIFDAVAKSYMCTNSIDESAIRSMVSEAIDLILEDSFAVKLPIAIKDTLEGAILHGGKAK